MSRERCNIVIGNYPSFNVPMAVMAQPSYATRFDLNSGNILIHDYTVRRLDYEWDNTVFFGNNVNCYMVLAANMLRPQTKFTWEWWYKTLSRHPRLYLMGLGAQATLEEMNAAEYAKTLPAELVRWVQMAADCSASIGVRGSFTGDVLTALGVKNYDVIGCPSWYVNGYEQVPIIKKPFSLDLRPAFGTCWEPYTPWHSAWHKAVLDNMLPLTDPCFVMQSEFNFVPYMTANNDIMQFTSYFTPDDLRQSSEAVKAHFALDDYDVYENGKIKRMFLMFSDMDKWASFIKTRDVSFGFRYHGSVIALKNGVPAICIVSDSRTYELCSFFKIPFVRVDEVASDALNFPEIYEKADFSAMNREYRPLLDNYISFLNKNGIRHNFTPDATADL